MAQQHTNRLSRETSPYLQQHAHNPVDWYAWGPEAFAAASKQNKPIFLSVGYSTCYWCHVMERESFEDPRIAAQMNRSFVCIKVDREERPDVDQLYMMAVQLITHSGGWPMSVFLTPELAPFYGGTYFPPSDYAGRAGFPTLLRSISDAWETRREEVERSAQSLVGALERYGRPAGAQVATSIDEAFIDNMIGRSVSDYDRQFGGFGGAPKFPRETLLELLLAYCDTEPRGTPARVEIAQMLGRTLEMMARGGIRDQLGGGFHRYSTDQRWLVPHFEIMLYDNAMLLGIYAWASRLLGRGDFEAVARGVADFVLGEMAGASGEFLTAFDAEVDGREGQSYLWTRQQVAEVLSEREAAVFARAYGLDGGANFVDPHHGSGRAEANVLYVAEAADEAELAPIRAKLLAARKARKQPTLDTKVLTGWNGLMIRNLAMAGRMLSERRYVDAAARAMRFVLQRHRMADGGLYHGSRDGEARVAGFLDDYAAIALALAELNATTGEKAWMSELEALLAQVQRRFGSLVGAFYFTDTEAADLPVRQMVAADSPLPSGNAMMALVYAGLGRTKQAAQIVSCFADALDAQGEAHSTLVQAAMACIARQGAIHVAPRDVAAEMQAFTRRAGSAVKVNATKLDGRRYRVNVSIADGFHIYAGEHLRLSLNAPAHVAYPPATARLGEIDVYEGEIPIDLTLEQEQSDPPQMYLDYQVCTQSECLPHTRVAVALK